MEMTKLINNGFVTLENNKRYKVMLTKDDDMALLVDIDKDGRILDAIIIKSIELTNRREVVDAISCNVHTVEQMWDDNDKLIADYKSPYWYIKDMMIDFDKSFKPTSIEEFMIKSRIMYTIVRLLTLESTVVTKVFLNVFTKSNELVKMLSDIKHVYLTKMNFNSFVISTELLVDNKYFVSLSIDFNNTNITIEYEYCKICTDTLCNNTTITILTPTTIIRCDNTEPIDEIIKIINRIKGIDHHEN